MFSIFFLLELAILSKNILDQILFHAIGFFHPSEYPCCLYTFKNEMELAM